MSNTGILSSVIKYILLLILIGIVFEVGFVSSNIIVTGQPPDINKLINIQIDEITSLINLIHGPGDNSQETIKINNPNDVSKSIQSKSNMDGVDLQTLAAHTNESTSNDEINVTITVTAYKTTTTGTNVTNGSIIIKPNETYSITATAIGKTENGGVTIDLNSLVITTIRKLYSNSGNGT